MPSTRAVARIESPCSCAWRMAFQSVCWRGVGGRSGLTRACGEAPLAAVPFAAAGSSGWSGGATPEPRPRARRSSAAPSWRSTRRWSASPRASAPVAVHPARRRTRLRPTARSSTPLRPPSCARRPRGRRRAGSRFNRPYCRDSRCAPPPGCSASHATPSGGTSAPAAHPGARVRHHLPSATSQTDIFAEPLSGQSR